MWGENWEVNNEAPPPKKKKTKKERLRQKEMKSFKKKNHRALLINNIRGRPFPPPPRPSGTLALHINLQDETHQESGLSRWQATSISSIFSPRLESCRHICFTRTSYMGFQSFFFSIDCSLTVQSTPSANRKVNPRNATHYTSWWVSKVEWH